MRFLMKMGRSLANWWHLRPDSPDLEEAERRQREITARLEALQRNRDILARRPHGQDQGRRGHQST